VWKWGLIGAPLASMAGVVLVSLPINLRAVVHELGLTVRQFVLQTSPLLFRIVAIAATAALGATWAAAHLGLS